MKIIHLPSYDINPYQRNLADAQIQLGHEVLLGGGGGNFFRTALFKWKADVLHFHWLHPYLLKKSKLGSVIRATRFLIEVLILKVSGYSIVWTIHNLQNHSNVHIGIERFFTVLFCRLCNERIAHTSEAARLAEDRFHLKKDTVTVIPHPSYVGLYPDNVSRDKAREILNLRDEDKVFLFLGRINRYKGIFDLIEAFESLDTNATLVIAGVPEDEESQQKLLEYGASNDRVILRLERVNDDELQTFFRGSDVAVFPYKQILTSGAMILAMSFGISIIAPNVSSIRETIGEEGALFYTMNNIGSLTEAMRKSMEIDTEAMGLTNYRIAS
ncbi:MAG: glycosyltransferase family 4 protein, partial [Flavobacteriaceae bacterium]